MILENYNKISNKPLNNDDFLIIFPKIILILNKINIDEVGMVELIDVLLEFKELNKIDQITEESIKIVIKAIKNTKVNLEGVLYFPLILKHMLLPYQLDKCDEEYNLLLFLSEFDILVESISKVFEKKDFEVLFKYNQELVKTIIEYKKAQKIYKECPYNQYILSTMISHLVTTFYFNQGNYDNKYDLIVTITKNIVDGYQGFINYCYNEGIYENFTKIYLEEDKIQKEYIVSQNMLDYAYEIEKEEKRK